MSKGIAIIGAGMIGAAHANGYRAHLPRFGGKAAGLELVTVCDAQTEMAQAMADTYGFQSVVGDWKEVLADDRIGIVSVALPNFLHAEVVAAALDAGKHVICEKPLALSAADARMLTEKAKQVNVCAATVFNYRRYPAVTEIRNLIRAGELGELVHVRVQYESEYAADPNLPHSWRYVRKTAGGGALLDVGTHAIDAARYLAGDITEICGAVETISIKERFVAAGATKGHDRVDLSTETRPVDNDDVVSCVMRFASGAQGVLCTSRVAVGMGNTLSIAISGTRGTVRYCSMIPGQYEIARFDGSGQSTFTTVLNRPASPFASEYLPVPHDGVAVGYAEVFGFMIAEFLSAIIKGEPMASGSLEDGLRAAEVIEAIQQSAEQGRPVRIADITC